MHVRAHSRCAALQVLNAEDRRARQLHVAAHTSRRWGLTRHSYQPTVTIGKRPDQMAQDAAG